MKKYKLIFIAIILIAIFEIWYYKNYNVINAKAERERIEVREIDVSNSVFELETSNLNVEELKKVGLPIILDFSAQWCGPCKTMEPEIIAINNEMKGKAIIKKIDVDRNANLANEFNVAVIPTQFFFNSDGTPYVPENIRDIKFELIKNDSGEHILTKHISILTLDQMKQILKEMGVDE